MTAAETTPVPWWEATPAGSEVAVGLVKIDRVGSTLDWSELPEPAVLRLRAQYTAGVERVAEDYGAAQPLCWQGDGVMLFLGGAGAQDIPLLAFRAAKQLWERLRIDLNMQARIAAHVAHVRWDPNTGTIASRDVDLCGHLEAVAPPGAVVASEDVFLALPQDARHELAPLGVTARDQVPAYGFPSNAVMRKNSAAFLPDGDQQHWDAFRRYALGPEVRLLRYVGFRLQKKQPPSLDIREVFEPPQVDLREMATVRDLLTKANLEFPMEFGPWASGRDQAGTVRVASIREAVAGRRSLVVLGDPGSGKTTLLKWLAVIASGGRFVTSIHLGISEPLLPVLVSIGRIAELRRSMQGGAASVPAAMARYFHDRSLGEEAALRDFLVRELERGRCLLLLDGLDEVRRDERDAIHRWIEAFAAAYPQNRCVVSSRLVGYGGIALAGSVEIALRPFDDTQIERYARAFHRSYMLWETGGEQPAEADKAAEALLGALRTSPRLRGLAANPFLLSALALIHRAEGRLPRHRVQAYELFARALCETWAEARRLVAGPKLDPAIAYEEEALPILGDLALAMQEAYPTGVAPEPFVIETLAGALRQRKGGTVEEARQAAHAFLERAGRDVQILLERGAGAWGFLHLTFQEFFAAAGLHAAERFEEVALKHLFDARWEEVIRLGVGYLALVQKRPEAARKFVERVLRWKERGKRQWITTVLARQIPLAALLAAEAGDALPVALQEEIAQAFARWLVTAPKSVVGRTLDELALTDFRDRIVPRLVEQLNDEQPAVRVSAIQALGQWRVAGAADAIVTMLWDQAGDVRSAASKAIPEVYRDELMEKVNLALADDRSDVRRVAIAVVGRLPLKVPVQNLIAMLADDNEFVRREAAFALERSGSQDAREALRRSIASHPGLHWEDIHALGILGCHEDLIPLLQGDDALIAVPALAISGGETTLEALLSAKVPLLVLEYAIRLVMERLPLERRLMLLQSVDERLRAAAAAALGGEKSVEVLIVLLAALRDKSVRVRLEAVRTLGIHPLEAAVQGLELALKDDDSTIREEAALALCARGSAAQALEVCAILRSAPQPLKRMQAAFALGKLGSDVAVDTLIEAVGDMVDFVREAAATSLGMIGNLAAVPTLLKLLERSASPYVTEAAREALWKLSERPDAPGRKRTAARPQPTRSKKGASRKSRTTRAAKSRT